MFNQFSQQLKQWHSKRDEQKWVLGTLYKIDGPSYRSPGAMMLFNNAGEQLGPLRGG
jgi:xanthine dehydrogenase accessory factor